MRYMEQRFQTESSARLGLSNPRTSLGYSSQPVPIIQPLPPPVTLPLLRSEPLPPTTLPRDALKSYATTSAWAYRSYSTDDLRYANRKGASHGKMRDRTTDYRELLFGRCNI